MGRITKLICIIAASSFVAACVTTAPPTKAVVIPAAGKKPALPKVELTRDILYDILLGEIAGQRGQLGVAVTALTRAAEKTRDPRLAERATLTAIYAKRYPKALRTARLWVELVPNNSDAHESLAIVLLATGNTDEATAAFKQVLRIAGTGDSLRRRFVHIASVLGQQRNRTLALKVMHVLVSQYPKDHNSQYALAHLAVRLGDLDTGLRAIDRALALRPRWEDAALFKARVLISQKDSHKTQRFFERYLSRYRDARRMRTHYARYLVDLKQWEKALRQFRHVVRLSPNDERSLFALGLLCIQTNRLADADTYLRRALKISPNNDQVKLYLGQVAAKRQHYAQAIKWYSGILDSGFVFESKVRIAIMLAKQGNIDGARDRLHKISPSTDQQRVKLILAEEQILRTARQYKEALKVLNSALKSLPGNKDLLYARALVAEKLNMLDVHERDLRTILKTDPNNAHALNALGYTLADKTTRYQEAKQLIERALKLRPNDPYIIDSMGWVHYRMKNYQQAIKYIRQALSISADAEISAHMGEVLWVLGKKGEAHSVWSKALKITPDNEVLLRVIKKFRR